LFSLQIFWQQLAAKGRNTPQLSITSSCLLYKLALSFTKVIFSLFIKSLKSNTLRHDIYVYGNNLKDFGSDYMQMKPGEMSDRNVSNPKKKYQ
jgi:hypothetical protein